MENIPTHTKRILGLDLGIASVGWAVVELDEANNTGRLIDCGARTFPAAEIPKTGESPNLPRREARSARRRLYRLANRMRKIRQLFLQYGLVDNSYFIDDEPIIDENKGFQQLHQRVTKQATPYQLRVAGLQRRLTTDEWVVVLTHLAKRRGYKSNSKRQDVIDGKLTDKQKESQQAKAGIAENKALLAESSYQTVGEMLYTDKKFRGHKRNKAGDYNHSIHRDDLLQEITILFDKQRTHGNPYATQQFEVDYKRVWEHQLSFDRGNIADKVGHCTFEKKEKRAPKHSYSAECFRLWQSINNLSVYDRERNSILITKEQRQTIADAAWNQQKITYAKVRSILGLSTDIHNEQFAGLRYPAATHDDVKNPESRVFVAMTGYHQIKSAFKKYIEQVPITESWEQFSQDTEQLDTIIEILSLYKDDEKVRRKLRKALPELPQLLIEELLGCDVTGFGHLSIKVLQKITPHLQQGLTYDKAVERAGYSSYSDVKKAEKLTSKLSHKDLEQVRNPMVLRPLAQARKVVNAVIRKYGLVHEVHIELLRDMAKSKSDRDKIQKGQDYYREQRDSARQQFIENHGHEPSGDQLLKYRLYFEQKCECPYSGQQIDPGRLLEGGYVDVDHILPLSRSMDDSLNNKVLCLSSENRQKGNKIPYEYFIDSGKDWNKFVLRTNHYKKAKLNRLHRTSFTEQDASDWKGRNVEKTTSAYISKFFKDYLESHLEFLPLASADEASRIKVQTRNGALTSFLRTRWGLHKAREEGDQHHAQDAVVIACATQQMVHRVSTYNSHRESHLKEKLERQANAFPTPWYEFRTDVAERLSTITISRPPRKKVGGALHKETVYRKKGDKVIKPLAVDSITDKNIEKMVGKNGDGKALYEHIVSWLTQKQQIKDENKDRTKDNKLPIPPLTHPTTGDAVHHIHIYEVGQPIAISASNQRNRGFADPARMVRIDIFSKPNEKGVKQFYFIPVYSYQMIRDKKLPTHLCTRNKPEREWNEVDNSYTFMFSLHHDDFVRIVNQKGEVIEGYFNGANRNTASITITDKHKQEHKSKGIKELKYIKKYDISVLGEKHEIKREKRCEPVAKFTH